MQKIQINNVFISGKSIIIGYSISDGLASYFTQPHLFVTEYSRDLTNLPQSIAIIPFICNILPIVWLTNSEIIVNEIDQDFYNSIENFKKGYIQMYPMLDFQGKFSALRVIKNTPILQNKTACFFSAGIDAFATLIAHLDQSPELISLRGSDIDLNDIEGWKNFESILAETKQKFTLPQETITTNFRKILNEEALNNLISSSGDGWWHGFQHGIGLIGHAAPLAFLNGYKKVYIASSYTIREKGLITCASDPSIDNFVKFCNTEVSHDQYEYNRQEKVKHICDFISQKDISLPLHVCWESKGGKNCCHCEKCYRTIMEIFAENGDPTKFNFHLSPNFFALAKKDIRQKIYMAPHIIVLWKDIQMRLHQQKNLKNDAKISWIKRFDFQNVNNTLPKKIRRFYNKIWDIIHYFQKKFHL